MSAPGRPALIICPVPVPDRIASLLSRRSCVLVDMTDKGIVPPVLQGLTRRAVAAGPSVFGRHDGVCLCCVGRPALVSALHGLYQDMMRGGLPECTQVLVLCPEEQTEGASAAVSGDPFILSRFNMTMLSC